LKLDDYCKLNPKYQIEPADWAEDVKSEILISDFEMQESFNFQNP